MEKYPFHVIQCISGHLPVYKVQLVDQSTRFGILQRNLLFPLAMRNESNKKEQDMEEKEPKLTDSEEENDASSVEHVDNYEGPTTRSKLKGWKMHCYLKLTL